MKLQIQCCINLFHVFQTIWYKFVTEDFNGIEKIRLRFQLRTQIKLFKPTECKRRQSSLDKNRRTTQEWLRQVNAQNIIILSNFWPTVNANRRDDPLILALIYDHSLQLYCSELRVTWNFSLRFNVNNFRWFAFYLKFILTSWCSTPGSWHKNDMNHRAKLVLL